MPFRDDRGAALMPVRLGDRDSRRTYALIALMFGGVALVGVSTGVLTSLAGSGPPPPVRRTASQAVVTPSPDPTPSASDTPPSRPADSDVEPGRRTDIGYFLSARKEDDGVHTTFDRVQLRASGVVNENPRTRELVLAQDVAVAGGLDRLLQELPDEGRTRLLELSYDALGYVIEIREKSVR
jgi:hypothetical protein